MKTTRSESLGDQLIRRHADVLTHRQREVLKMVGDHFEQSGAMPTMEEVAEAIGVSKQAAVQFFLRFAAKGVMRSGYGKRPWRLDGVSVNVSMEKEKA